MLSNNALLPGGSTLGGLVPHRSSGHSAHIDMTAMVDLVFMMNIFFLVTTLVTALAEVDLPAAQHVTAADLDSAVVITVTGAEGQVPQVYLGDGTSGEALSESELEDRIIAEVESGKRAGKTAVVIKAEKQVPLRQIGRIAAAATSVDGVELNLAVMEKDE
jgi:biopolymer transport protein ExbD